MEMDNLENVVYVIRSLSAVTCDVEVFHIKICVLTSIGEREIILVMITCSDLIIEKERKHRREGKMEKKSSCVSRKKKKCGRYRFVCGGEKGQDNLFFVFFAFLFLFPWVVEPPPAIVQSSELWLLVDSDSSARVFPPFSFYNRWMKRSRVGKSRWNSKVIALSIVLSLLAYHLLPFSFIVLCAFPLLPVHFSRVPPSNRRLE